MKSDAADVPVSEGFRREILPLFAQKSLDKNELSV